jgi:hypothetical protein
MSEDKTDDKSAQHPPPDHVKHPEYPRLIFKQGTLASFAAHPYDLDRPETIVALAIKCVQNREEYLFVAYAKARRFQLIRFIMQQLGDKYSPMVVANQGFLSSHGRFVARTHARLIAEQVGQLLGGAPSASQLHSEDIW